MNIQIISRKEAKEQGLKKYFTGKPCKHGHIDIREVKKGRCMECCRMYALNDHYKNREQNLKKMKCFYEKNIEKQRERCLNYRNNNIEKARINTKKYRVENPFKIKEIKEKRRARICGNGGTHSHKDALKILQLQNYKCVNCGCCLKENKKHKDHIMPLKLGGTNNINNIQWLCAYCNVSKHAKEPIAWAQSQGRLL